MTKLLPFLALALALPTQAADAANPVEAVKSGKATVELRTRYEHVDDEASKKTADALTNRLAISFKTGTWKGLSAFAQFENVANVAEPRFMVPQTGYGKTNHAVVADPPLSQLNQFYLEYQGLKVGRQALNLDNQRFIGAVAWRQNDQTFTGASYARESKYVNFTLGHFTKVHNIFGQTKPIAANVLNVNVKVIPGGNLRVFHYAFDEGDQATGSGATFKDTSFAHTGGRVDGKVWNILYDVSYANQRRTKGATANGTLEVKYAYLGVGYAIGKDHSVSVAQEKLEGGFKTPYATLHAWNGWADRFLTTPGSGLTDSFLQYKKRWATWGVEASYHSYKGGVNDAKYGKELNLSADYKVASWLTVLGKIANYSADAETATIGAANKDLKKFWLQTMMKF
jgi:hypothetical protein